MRQIHNITVCFKIIFPTLTSLLELQKFSVKTFLFYSYYLHMSLFLSCYSLHLSIKIKIQHYCNCTLYDLIHSQVVKRPQRHETTTKIANEFSSKSYIIAYYLLKKHCSCVKHYHLPIQLSQMLQIRKQYIPKTISHSNWNRVSFDNQFFNLDTYSLTD